MCVMNLDDAAFALLQTVTWTSLLSHSLADINHLAADEEFINFNGKAHTSSHEFLKTE